MADALIIGIRFLLFADLMLIVGLAAFPLYAFPRARPDETGIAVELAAIQPWLCGTGFFISFAGMLVLIARMQGIAIGDVAPGMLVSIATETEVGKAWIVRMLALAAAMIAAGQLHRRPTGAGIILSLTSATALASLVWSGHAAASEGLAGTIHRAADALHMIAAGIWIGAIAAFLILLRPVAGHIRQARFRMIARSLERFARVGTGCVIAIAATGLIGFQMIVGLGRTGSMLRSSYGLLLAAKLLFFVAMLALAALNRWRLTPMLSDADGEPSVAAIRYSLALEASIAMGILALVALLGILEP